MSHKNHSSKCPNKKEVIKRDLTVCGNTDIKKDLKVGGDLDVEGTTTLNDTMINGKLIVDNETVDKLTVNSQLIIPRINTTVVSPVGKKGDLVYDTSIPNPNDNVIKVSDGTQWSNVPENPVGGVYIIKPDGTGHFSTIQSGIDYCSSGLKPNASSNLLPPLPPGAKNVKLNVLPGVYNESLIFDNSFSIATPSDPSEPLPNTPNLPGRGLVITGDTRPIANMTYIYGGTMSNSSIYSTGVGQNNLGAVDSIVTLSNVGNKITVSLSANPQPDFIACGIVPGDTIVIADTDGSKQQRNVILVTSTSITYDGLSAPVSGHGASLTFCSNVQVISNSPNAICSGSSGAVQIQGIWFSVNPAFSTTGVYGMFFQNYIAVTVTNLLIDCRNLPSASPALELANGCQFIGSIGSDTNSGPITVFGGVYLFNAYMTNGYYYVLANSGQGAGGVRCWDMYACSNASVDCVQMNGASSTSDGGSTETGTDGEIDRCSAFNCATGFIAQFDSNVVFHQVMIIETCTTGINVSSGNFVMTGNGSYAGLTPRITNSTTAFNINRNGQFVIYRPLIVNTATTGFLVTNNSKFTANNTVTYSGVTNPYVIDATSIYSTLQNTSTDPSPSNVYTYTASEVMNSGYLNQLVDTSSPLTITLNPATLTNNAFQYRGKTYNLYSSMTSPFPQAHILKLTGAGVSFVGQGVGATVSNFKTTATFNALNLGEGLTFTVMSNTQVQVTSSIGVTFST